ncbi:MAG TPA: L,D-transpeptidase family protein, partial [Catenuloplanes sp.]
MGRPRITARTTAVVVAAVLGAGLGALPLQPSAASAAGACQQGEHHRAVEIQLRRLGGFGPMTVDGRQSAADCAAIIKFQRRYDIRPAHGRAGPTTLDVARRLADTDTRRCNPGAGTVICVNLTLQTVWAMRGGKVIMKPTVTRTGMRGYRTPAGTYRINKRTKREWSEPYEVWLPYWQHFHRGMGFHQTTTYLHNKPIGSHGCVNLLPSDARALWGIGRMGTKVKVF